jgi:lysozyme family protein
MPVDLVALVGAALTSLGLLVHAALFAFFLGKLSARLTAIETRARDIEDGTAALAAMTATLHALKESVDDIKVTFSRRFEAVEQTVKTLLMARSRRAAAAALMTEQERFDRCLAEVLRLEGGYVDDPRDPGGATKFGVTRAVLSEACGRAVSAEAVSALTRAEAAEIYRNRYWTPTRSGELPAGLDLVVFDAAVNMGPGTAARLLQAALGVAADGVVGPRTLAAALGRPAAETVRTASELRRARYRGLSGFHAFGRGWLRRADAVEALALAWAEPVPIGLNGESHVV